MKLQGKVEPKIEDLPREKISIPDTNKKPSKESLLDLIGILDEDEPPKKKKSKDLPDHIIRILAIMWINSHTRAAKKKQFSTETEIYTKLVEWLEAHP